MTKQFKIKLMIILLMMLFSVCFFIYLGSVKPNDDRNEKIIKLEKQNDSLNLVVYQKDLILSSRDSLIIGLKKRQMLIDSLINKNHNNLKNEKIKVKNFTTDSRSKYVDSLLKSAGIRK